jgi:hypothetical protein
MDEMPFSLDGAQTTPAMVEPKSVAAE